MTLHPIHPALQFEAKHAIRFLDNLLRVHTGDINYSGGLFGAVGMFATGRDAKDDFAPLQGHIGEYDFKWNKDTLECTCESSRHVIRRGTFEVDFGDARCDFFGTIWDCPLPEARTCVRTSVSRMAERLGDFTPATDGGIALRFKSLAKRYRLNAKERDLLLVGLCVSHSLLRYNLEGDRCNSNALIRLEEAAGYLGCGVDDIMPLVCNGSGLVAWGLIDDDLTPSREVLEYFEGRVVTPAIQARRISLSARECKDLDEWISQDDEF